LTDRDPPRVILASTSAYRRGLLARLGVPFECLPPGCDERRLAEEPARALAERLARLKAEAVAALHPDAVVIGSDQVAVRGPEILGKPGTVERCTQQLQASSGREVAFLTAVHVVRRRDRALHRRRRAARLRGRVQGGVARHRVVRTHRVGGPDRPDGPAADLCQRRLAPRRDPGALRSASSTARNSSLSGALTCSGSRVPGRLTPMDAACRNMRLSP
jgi:hypothetical protein